MTPPQPAFSPVKPTRILAVATLVALGVWTVIELVSVAVDLRRADLAASAIEDPDGFDAATMADNDDLVNALSFIDLGGMLLVAAILIAWLFRTRANAEVISDFPHTYGRPWIVFGWVLPILNLWIPRQVVSDLWTASDPEPKQRFLRTPILVFVWWFLWLPYLLGTRLVGKLSGNGPNFEGIRDEALVYVWLAPIGIGAAVLAGLVVWRITRFQEGHAIRLAAAPA